MLKHAIAILWKNTPGEDKTVPPPGAPGGMSDRASNGMPPISEYLVIGLPLAFLLVLGLWMPHGLSDFLTKALDSLWSMK
jgi:hypothetical protein